MNLVPKVSVIIPVYNTEQYLSECLDSVLSQTLREIEIICINDGSPDNSLSILREYEKKDVRIQVIDKVNEGVGRARNDGIRSAQGEYLAFMDSDDYYPKESVLEKLYLTAVENQVQICGGYYLPDGRIEDLPHGEEGQAPAVKGKCRYADYQYDFGYTCYIYKRKLLINNQIFFPPYGRFQDPPFFVRAMVAAETFFAVDEPTYCYRATEGSGKCSFSKTMDMLLGIMDNLKISREKELSKLHYLSAVRLEKDASYMGIQNLFDQNNQALFARFMQAVACVDTVWLRSEGYDLPEPFLPEFFTYTLVSAQQVTPQKIASFFEGEHILI